MSYSEPLDRHLEHRVRPGDVMRRRAAAAAILIMVDIGLAIVWLPAVAVALGPEFSATPSTVFHTVKEIYPLNHPAAFQVRLRQLSTVRAVCTFTHLRS